MRRIYIILMVTLFTALSATAQERVTVKQDKYALEGDSVYVGLQIGLNNARVPKRAFVLLTPVIKFRSQNPQQERFCSKECVACTRVCPTGALKMLSVKEKEETSIGVAKLDKVKCIAWEKQEYCVVCQEFCPYQAVIEEEHKGVNCPIIDEAKCRGCGACESQCPALPIAIIIERRQ